MIGGLAAMLLAAILFPYAKKKRESRASSTRKASDSSGTERVLTSVGSADFPVPGCALRR